MLTFFLLKCSRLAGSQEGCKVYDNAFAVGDLAALHALTINEKQFQEFFYNKKPQLSMTNVVKYIQKVRVFFSPKEQNPELLCLTHSYPISVATYLEWT
jgi:hypothetical protein